MRDILERMRSAARGCLIYEDGSDRSKESYSKLNDAIKDYQTARVDDPCSCGRELVVTNVDVNCPVHGMPSIGIDHGKPGSDVTAVAIIKDGKVIKDGTIIPPEKL